MVKTEDMTVERLKEYVLKTSVKGRELYDKLEHVTIDYIREHRPTQHAVVVACIDLLCCVAYAAESDLTDIVKSVEFVWERVAETYGPPRDVTSDEAKAKQGDKSVS